MSRKKLIVLLASSILLLSIAATSLFLTHNTTAAHASFPGDGGLPSTCYTDYPSVSYGATGTWAKAVQNNLIYAYQHGRFHNTPYNFHPPLAADGKFGPNTLAAVKDFQKAQGLQVDGIVGPHTWYALNKCAEAG